MGDVRGQEWISFMCGEVVMGCSIFGKKPTVLRNILGIYVPLNPQVMLLLDCEHFKISMRNDLVANMLTTATCLWQRSGSLTEDWISKV